MIAASVSAELLKLRKRPSTWTLAAVLVAIVALFGYLFVYFFASGGGGGAPGMDMDAFISTLLPDNVAAQAVGQATGLGAPIGLIFGALSVGTEYSLGTVKTIALQRPRRAALFTGKLLAAAVVTLGFTALVFATATVCSLIVATLEDIAVTWPPASDLLIGFASAWLVISLWAALGSLLATAFRGTGLAIGLGLVYALVLEGVISILPLGEGLRDVVYAMLISTNVQALAGAVGELAEGFGGPSESTLPEPWQAALVLGAYLIAAAAATVLIFRRRPVV